METETIYRCSVCGCTYQTAEQAKVCEEQKPELHKYAVGDVLKIRHYPGDYCEDDYMIVENLVWDDEKRHKLNPQYRCDYRNVYMTSNEREQLLEMAKDKAESLDVSPYDIEWDHKNGEYTFPLRFGKKDLPLR